ncbi:unnamed protein product, partial [Ectocarpus sp. 13 AM-2016]
MWFGKKTIPQRTCAHLHFMPCYLNELVPDSSTDRHSRRRSSSALLLCMCPRTHMPREILKFLKMDLTAPLDTAPTHLHVHSPPSVDSKRTCSTHKPACSGRQDVQAWPSLTTCMHTTWQAA